MEKILYIYSWIFYILNFKIVLILRSTILITISFLSTWFLLLRYIERSHTAIVSQWADRVTWKMHIHFKLYMLFFLGTTSKATQRPLWTLARGSPGRKAPLSFFSFDSSQISHNRSILKFTFSLVTRWKTLSAGSSQRYSSNIPIYPARATRLLDKKHCAPLYELSWGLLACLSLFI